LYGQQQVEILSFPNGLNSQDRVILLVNYSQRFAREIYLWNASGLPQKLSLPPETVPLTVFENHLVVKVVGTNDSGWPARAGSLFAIPLQSLGEESPHHRAQVLWTAKQFSAVDNAVVQGDRLFLNIVRDSEQFLRVGQGPLTGSGIRWKNVPLLPSSFLSLSTVGDRNAPEAFIQNSNFVHSTRSSLAEIVGDSVRLREWHREVDFLDASRFEQVKLTAQSRDGTPVIYRLVFPKNTVWNGRVPVVFGNYSGHYFVYSPRYNMQRTAEFWLARGGVFAFAHARGGSERGLEWSEQGMGAGMQKTVDDIVAAAEDLIRRGVTTSTNLGLVGGSHGMTIATIVANQKPALFRAMHVGYGVQDLLNYTNLLQASIWTHWFGFPWIPEHRAWLEKLSPLQNLPRATRELPAMWIQGGALDTNVHPVHSRLYAQALEEMNAEFYFHEGPKTGHGTNPDLDDAFQVRSMAYSFMWQKLTAETLSKL
jgi:prolyl oligopeptidase